MAIDLKKGGKINLSKDAPGLSNLLVRLNWTPQGRVGEEFDLDTSVFMLAPNATGTLQLLSDDHFIFYNNKTSPDDSVVHAGDDKTGASGEQIAIDLAKVDPNVHTIAFIVTIHEADVRKQNFGQVTGSSIELLDAVSGTSIAKYALDDDFSTQTAIEFGNIYRRADGAWAFSAVGTGYDLGLAEFVKGYGGGV